ncbi:MAG: HEAT repeat domain-containing protein [Desulfobacterota bacterium]|nr:HEAT repeat domain-containing protein [Thermodesulfobacteriota bacterium]
MKYSKGLSPQAKKVENFAITLLQLIRGVRVYPAKHPTIIEAAQRVLRSIPWEATGTLTIGVTPKELIVSGEFIGHKASELASFLHEKKILQVSWTHGVTLDDLWAFARVVSTPKLEGELLREKLRNEVPTIDILPLNLREIHRETMDTPQDPQATSEERRRRAWLVLMSQDSSADQLASVITTEEFWNAAKEEWTRTGLGDSEGFTEFLLRLGERLEEALALLPPSQREVILNYLAQMGRCLAIRDLVRIVGREGEESKRLGLVRSSLLRDLDLERFVDLLAGLAAMGERGTQRFVEIYRRFLPVTDPQEVLALVRSKMAQSEASGISPEVWKTVETLILNLTENPFMDSEYSDSLRSFMEASKSSSMDEKTDLPLESPDYFLDFLYLALGLEEEQLFQTKLIERIKARTEQLGPFGVLSFVAAVDRTFPRLLDSHAYLVRSLFEKGLSAIGKATFKERQSFIRFALTHEKCLLDTALKALAEERKISTRFFLVNLLSCFSFSSTPVFISKSRTGPWYLARNLAIVLGQQGFPQVLPHLRALTHHPHPKVKKEAVHVLKRFESTGEETLALEMDPLPRSPMRS